MGAIAAGGVEVLSDDLIRRSADSATRSSSRSRRASGWSSSAATGSSAATVRRPIVRDRTVILVDDGLATGSTMQAAIIALRQQAPARIVVAVPVGARETCDAIRHAGRRVVCLSTPEPFDAVGLWYEDFSQTTDEEVRACSRRPARHAAASRRERTGSRTRSTWSAAARSR